MSGFEDPMFAAMAKRKPSPTAIDDADPMFALLGEVKAIEKRLGEATDQAEAAGRRLAITKAAAMGIDYTRRLGAGVLDAAVMAPVRGASELILRANGYSAQADALRADPLWTGEGMLEAAAGTMWRPMIGKDVDRAYIEGRVAENHRVREQGFAQFEPVLNEHGEPVLDAEGRPQSAPDNSFLVELGYGLADTTGHLAGFLGGLPGKFIGVVSSKLTPAASSAAASLALRHAKALGWSAEKVAAAGADGTLLAKLVAEAPMFGKLRAAMPGLLARYGPASVGFGAERALLGEGEGDERLVNAATTAALTPLFLLAGRAGERVTGQVRHVLDDYLAGKVPFTPLVAQALGGAVEGLGFAATDVHLWAEGWRGLFNGDADALERFGIALMSHAGGFAALKAGAPSKLPTWHRQDVEFPRPKDAQTRSERNRNEQYFDGAFRDEPAGEPRVEPTPAAAPTSREPVEVNMERALEVGVPAGRYTGEKAALVREVSEYQQDIDALASRLLRGPEAEDVPTPGVWHEDAWFMRYRGGAVERSRNLVTWESDGRTELPASRDRGAWMDLPGVRERIDETTAELQRAAERIDTTDRRSVEAVSAIESTVKLLAAATPDNMRRDAPMSEAASAMVTGTLRDALREADTPDRLAHTARTFAALAAGRVDAERAAELFQAPPARPSHRFRQLQVETTTDERVSRGAIRKQMERTSGSKITFGRGWFAERKAAGWYDPRTEITGVKVPEDVLTEAHEFGHAIHPKLFGSFDKRFGGKVDAELDALGRELYGSRVPAQKHYRAEGVAEYVARRLLRDPDLGTVAPEFGKVFDAAVAKHPKIAKGFAELERMFRVFAEQGAVGRLEAGIQFVGDPRVQDTDSGIGLRKSKLRDLRTHLVSDTAAVHDLVAKLAAERGVDVDSIPITKNPAKLIDVWRFNSYGIAEAFVMRGAVDPNGTVLGPSLREALARIPREEYRQFMTWNVARRLKVYQERGLPVGHTPTDVDVTLRTFDSPTYRAASDAITDWAGLLMQYPVALGVLSPDTAARIRHLNPVYLKMRRVFDEHVEQTSQLPGQAHVAKGSLIKSITGSSRMIEDPLLSLVEEAQRVISFSHKARIAHSAADLAEMGQGGGWFAHRIEPPKEVRQASLDRIIKELEDRGMTVEHAREVAAEDAFIDLVLPAVRYDGKEPIVAITRNGERQWWRLDKDLYRMLEQLDAETMPAFLSVIGARQAAELVRIGATGTRVAFALKQYISDSFASYVNSQGGMTPLGLTVGMLKDVKNLLRPGSHPEIERWANLGGTMATIRYADAEKHQRRVVDAVFRRSKKDKAIHMVAHPIEAVQAIIGRQDRWARVREFELLRDKLMAEGKPELEASLDAMLASKDLTINFGRAGASMRWLGSISPYINARAQDASKTVRMMSGKQRAGWLARGAAAVTIGTLVQWLLNRKSEWYGALPEHERQAFWHFEALDGAIIKMPKPQGLLGVLFGSVPEAILNAVDEKDAEPLAEALSDTLFGFLPALDLQAMLPAIFKVPAELATNRDFFRGRSIVPEWMERARLPEDQHGRYVTGFAKTLGEAFGISPAKIELVLRDATGGLALDAARMLDLVTGARSIDSGADVPVLGSFVARAPWGHSKQVQRFYDRLNELRQLRGSVQGSDAEKAELRRFEKAARLMNAVRARVDEEGGDREAAGRAIHEQAVQVLEGLDR